MPEFTVQAAEQVKSGIGRDNNMQVIALTLTDGTNTHEAEWFTSEATAVPQAGTRKAFTLEPSQYGLKAKAERTGFGGGARARDPKESAAIQRQHSQGCAIALLHVKAIAGALDADDLKPSKIKALADWFDDDIAAGVERKHPSQRMSRGLPVRNEPQRTGAPDVVTPSPEYQTVPPDGSEPWGLENA